MASGAFGAPPQRKKPITQHTVSLVHPRALFILFLPLPYGVGVSHSIIPVRASCLIGSTAPAVTSTDVNLKIPLKAVDAAALSTVHGEVVATKETGAYVLKPFRSPKSKKLRTAVVFVPRLSHFDIENERSNKNEFRVLCHPTASSSPVYTRHDTHHLCD
jgi:hypothetical protein